MRPSWIVPAVAAGFVAHASPAPAEPERTVARVTFPFKDGDRSVKVEASVTRQRVGDGGVQIKLITQGLSPRPQALTIYAGGGDDDGPSDKAVREVKAQAFDMPDGQKAVRVDLTFVMPGTKGDLQTDTTLVGFVGKPHKLLELPTGTQKARSRTCKETRGTSIRFSPPGTPLQLEASTTLLLESALGDDDLPVDKQCTGTRPVARSLYRWEKDRFVALDDNDD
jgi:hypothetical protein